MTKADPDLPKTIDPFTQERETLHRQMLSAVSHDLKTPLASIIGSMEIFKRMGAQLDEKKRATLLDTALAEAYRLDSFLTNILDLAKLENNLVPLRRESNDLRQLIEDMVHTLGSRKGQAKISVTGPKPLEVNIDGTLLARAVALLTDNAIKHAGLTPRIEIAYQTPKNGVLQITVADDGPGVPLDKHEEIFNKYTRLHRGDMQTAGTGLGLSIARVIANRLGGNLVILPPHVSKTGACFLLTVAI